MLILANPREQFPEYQGGTFRTIVVGSVPESRQWIKVVFEGTLESGEFLTAYRDRRLNSRYRGGPWDAN